ncbi:CAMK/CAMK1 protein kinase, variant 1 [Aphanomyces invadans]|uniref:CAMK/CAMK1 protein kinase, variant 1 n=1 Tax=Aphanomyces invadans TaxID=157072 RepID=A0A024TKJ9_9STRA|nr:CAMK/CAMK1 protein kinase, variant 1 [Aphanomyces invadans]ETV94675.1 CAMK/CAMK1 protein kinase, variant 1 [Aphanomyces invadans]|eukprot:XP_008876619.1 CAMK/CAMK1 protein kinase, variant 1 [Aphanomyces invadans]
MRSGWRRVLTAIPLLAATSPWNTAWSEAHTPKPRQRTKSISDKYEVGKVIGSGGFAVVKLAKDRTTGVEVAAKFFDMKTASTAEIEAEIDMLRWIGTHANIVSLRDVVYEPTDIIMIMDLVRGGELFDYIVSQGSITEADASRMLREVCLALQHLHQRGVCHRDLKPENLLLTEVSPDADIKIADFGQSLRLPAGSKLTESPAGGTIVYWAPEIIKRAPQDCAVDMWAFGVLVRLYSSPPCAYHADRHRRSCTLPSLPGVSNSWYNSLSDEAKDLLSHLLTVDPEKRFTAADALSHPWMNPRFRRRLSRRYRDGLSGRLQAYRRLQQLRANIVTVLLSQKLHKSPSGKHVVAPHTTDLETLNQDVYKEVFALFDEDQSGAISKHELANVLRALGQQYTPAEIDDIMKAADVDGDGGISLTEFTTLVNSSLIQVEQWNDADLHAAFEIFDVNHDGFISADELAYVMNVLDKTPISPAELHDLIQSIDENGDGKIDYKEFSTLMQAWLVEGRGQTKGK